VARRARDTPCPIDWERICATQRVAGGRKAWLWGCARGAGREGRGGQHEPGGRPVGTQNIGAGEPRAQVGEQRVLRHRRPHVVVPCRSNPTAAWYPTWHGTPLPSALTLRPTPYLLHPTFSTHDPLHALARSALKPRPRSHDVPLALADVKRGNVDPAAGGYPPGHATHAWCEWGYPPYLPTPQYSRTHRPSTGASTRTRAGKRR
jgi:hypothetical protein